MVQEDLKKLTPAIILILLVVLSFFLLKQILISILFGLILALVLFPLQKRFVKILKKETLSSLVICILFMILIAVPLWFLLPVLVKESLNLFLNSHSIDLLTPLKELFPSLLSSDQFATEIGSALSSFVTKFTSSIMNSLSNWLVNFPTLVFQFIVFLFAMFFALRDGERFVVYIKSIMPFSKKVEEKILKSSKDITFSVFYGQIILGVLEGLIMGAAFYIAGLDNAFLLMIFACIAGVFPVIGTSVIWIPVAVWLAFQGNFIGLIPIVLFGAITFILEIVKPLIVSRRTKIHSAIILIGMIGGILFFGIIGVILGPLILSYLLIVLEVYRDQRFPGPLVEGEDIKDKK